MKKERMLMSVISFNARKEEKEKLKEKLKVEEEKQPRVKELTEQTAEIKALLPEYDELSDKLDSFNKNKIFIDSSSGNADCSSRISLSITNRCGNTFYT